MNPWILVFAIWCFLTTALIVNVVHYAQAFL